MHRSILLLAGLLLFLFCSSSIIEQRQEEIEIDGIGYDIYGQNCAGGISIRIAKATYSRNKIGKSAFIKPALEKYKMPDGLIASGNNKLKFYGHFQYETCNHLMGTANKQELFFIYDSVDIYCPFNYWNSDKMEFDTITCEQHPSFHERIRLIQ